MLMSVAVLVVITYSAHISAIHITGSSGKENACSRSSCLSLVKTSVKNKTIVIRGGIVDDLVFIGSHTNYSETRRNGSCSKSQDNDKTSKGNTSVHTIVNGNIVSNWRKKTIYRAFSVFEKRVCHLILTILVIVHAFNTIYKSNFVKSDIEDKTPKGCHVFDTGYTFYMDVPLQNITIAMVPSFDGAKPKVKRLLTNSIDRQVDDARNSEVDTKQADWRENGISFSNCSSRGATQFEYKGEEITNNIVSYAKIKAKDNEHARASKNDSLTIQLNGQDRKGPYAGSNTHSNIQSIGETNGDRNTDSNNTTIIVDGTNTACGNVDNPNYVETEARYRTFVNWPTKNAGNIRDISNAGFYYIGIGDSVRCFCCGGGYYNFKPTTDPFREHFRLYPSCRFIKQAIADKRRTADDHGAGESTTQASVEHEHRNIAEETSLPETNIVKSTLSHSEIKNLLEMGFKKEQIEELICRQLSNGNKEETTDPILELLMSKQPENLNENDDAKKYTTRGNETATVLSSSGHMTAEAGNQCRNKKEDTTSGDISDPSSEEEAVQSMKAENLQLREHLLCKICLDKNSSVVFLNCGHMVSCPDCSKSIRKCPICRKFIRGRVEIQ